MSLIHIDTTTPPASVISRSVIPGVVEPGIAGVHLPPHSFVNSTQSGLAEIETAYSLCNSLRRWCECESDAHSHSGPCRRGRKCLVASGSL